MLRICYHRWAGPLLFLLIILGWAGTEAADELTTGKGLYAAKCQICHGANGRGDEPAGAALNFKPADFTNPLLISLIL